MLNLDDIICEVEGMKQCPYIYQFLKCLRKSILDIYVGILNTKS
jgi:hypothetical protein